MSLALNQILNDLHHIDTWTLDAGAVRTQILGKTACPITGSCWVRTGNLYTLDSIRKAATEIGLPHSLAALIINASDNILTNPEERHVRLALLHACRLRSLPMTLREFLDEIDRIESLATQGKQLTIWCTPGPLSVHFIESELDEQTEERLQKLAREE
jgi:hypothetical protein